MLVKSEFKVPHHSVSNPRLFFLMETFIVTRFSLILVWLHLINFVMLFFVFIFICLQSIFFLAYMLFEYMFRFPPFCRFSSFPSVLDFYFHSNMIRKDIFNDLTLWKFINFFSGLTYGLHWRIFMYTWEEWAFCCWWVCFGVFYSVPLICSFFNANIFIAVKSMLDHYKSMVWLL